MRATLLISFNFLRQMRWLLLIYSLIAIAFGLGLALENEIIKSEDVEFFFGQQAFYAVGIATLLAAQANLNERKSRRILGVLSKGIERKDYLAGLLGGVIATTGVFEAGVLLGAVCIIERSRFSFSQVFAAVMLMWLSCCLSAAIAMFFSTFLHPLLAVAGTFILIGSGWAAQRIGTWGNAVFPVYQLNLDANQLLQHARTQPVAIPVALLEIIIFWLLAGWIFERRDIAVAIE